MLSSYLYSILYRCSSLLMTIFTIFQISMRWLTSSLVSLLTMLDWVQGEVMDSAECLEKGFNSAKLLCSSCEDLKQFDLAKVAEDCLQCCVSDGGSSSLENTKYEKAILEVCG